MKKITPKETPAVPSEIVDTGTEQDSVKLATTLNEASIAEALSNMSAEQVDSIEKDNVVNVESQEETDDFNKGPAFPDPEEDNGHTIHSKEFYEKQTGFQPAIEVTKKKSGFSGKDTQEQFAKLSDEGKLSKIKRELAKPATEQDLSNLDESMIMDMPQIKASSFMVVDLLNLRPKDKSVRFRWANFKNNVAGNMGRYMALGFQVACVDDVDQEKTPIDASMIDGTQVKWYDVILLKCNVIRLMELYKSNILRSVMKLGRVKEKGIAEANRQFASDIAATPGASAAYNKVKAGLSGKEPVEFFTPGLEESSMLK